MQGQQEHSKESLPLEQLALLEAKNQERKHPEIPGVTWWNDI